MPGFLSTLRRLGITPEAIAAAVKRSKMPIVGGAGINVTSGPDIGTSISLLATKPAVPFSLIALVQVTGNLAGGGKYSGTIWKAPIAKTVSNTGNLAAAEIGQIGDAVMILNAAEVGQSTHDLTSGTVKVSIFPAYLLSKVFSTDSPRRPVYVITGIDWENCS